MTAASLAAITEQGGRRAAKARVSQIANKREDEARRRKLLANKMKGTRIPLKVPRKTDIRLTNGHINSTVFNILNTQSISSATMAAYQKQAMAMVNQMNKVMITGRTSSVQTNSTISNSNLWSTPGTSTSTIQAGNTITWSNDMMATVPLEQKLYEGRTYVLRDGTKIVVDAKGNYEIIDDEAKVIYKACRMREFNRYINSSDLLEEFIGYLKSMGVRRMELSEISISTFVNWLIVRAAEADGEPVPEEDKNFLLEDISKNNSEGCAHCGSRLPMALTHIGSRFCSGACTDSFLAVLPAAAVAPALVPGPMAAACPV